MNKLTIFSKFSSDEKERFITFNAINFNRSILNHAIDSMLNTSSDEDLIRINNILEVAVIDFNTILNDENKTKDSSCEDA